MKLPQFCYTNSGQLFCNCPRSMFLGGRGGAEMCCHFVAASKWLKNQPAGLFDKTKTNSVRCQANAIINPIRPGGAQRPGGGSEARMTKLTAANQKPLTL